jgi:hypothetical protein
MPRTTNRETPDDAAKVRVSVTEERLRDAGFDLTKGDSLAVPAALATYWCAMGWAEDPSGAIATGERIPGVRALDVQDNISKGAQ